MSTLRDNAAKLAGREPALTAYTPPERESGAEPLVAEPLPDVTMPDLGPDGPEQVPVYVAWSRVMADVRVIQKGGAGNEYTGPGSYSFRGVERTVNAFGPVLRKHGVLVLPVKVEPEWRDARTSGGKSTTETRVVVSWLVMGPTGDQLPMLLQSAGEALDSGDKGTTKAQSVAQRVLLLTAAQVPTNDIDPDSINVERGEAPVRSAASYRDEALDLNTSVSRLRQMHHELSTHRRLGELLMNEVGDQETIGALVARIGKERAQ